MPVDNNKNKTRLIYYYVTAILGCYMLFSGYFIFRLYYIKFVVSKVFDPFINIFLIGQVKNINLPDPPC